jgi:SAM-dependent methyltransferase
MPYVMTDPAAGSPWSAPGTVAGFRQSPPNPVLMAYAAVVRDRGAGARALDIGCGAARNAAPLAQLGWDVLGLDNSRPMLEAAAERARADGIESRLHVAASVMERLPVRDDSVDLVIAHGIWNLATSSAQFRMAVCDAARVAKRGAGLFVFTFSRNTIPEDATPVPGEEFVFAEFSGTPQCFLTADQLFREMERAGFTPDAAVPLSEYNRPRPGQLRAGKVPVIYEAAFRRT